MPWPPASPRRTAARTRLTLTPLKGRDVPAAGLAASYFDTRDFTGPAVTRTDPGVGFDWGRGSPDARLAVDTFSARWAGTVTAPVTGPATFHVTADDGVRLYVGGKLVVSDWGDHAARTRSGTATLEAGKPADIKLEYYENGGLASVKLEWEGAGRPRQVVPASALATGATVPPVSPPPVVPPTVPPTAPAAGRVGLASSFLGGAADDDGVRGAAIQADGTVIFAAKLGDANPGGVAPTFLNGATAASRGAIVRLSPDGRRVLGVTRVGAEVADLSTDAAGNLYVALGAGGLLKLNPTASAVLWNKPGRADRVDAAPNGDVVTLGGAGFAADGTGFTTGGTVTVHGGTGATLGTFATLGGRGTYDVAVDAATRSVFTTGFHQTKGPSGNPVQVAYVRSQGYDGTQKWRAYDWTGTQVDDPGAGGTGPTNNMADTRGLRIDVGADGKLYTAFQAAGGNHIFRYDPFDLRKAAKLAGGDKYHQFYNTASEHKTVLVRMDPATGAALLGQQVTNRLSNGKGNTIYLARGGDIQADAAGGVYLTGASAWGMPITFEPITTPDPYTGGAFLYVLSPDLTTRELVTRSGTGVGYGVAARLFPGETAARVAYGGTTAAGAWVDEAVQGTYGGGKADGFFTVYGPARALAATRTNAADGATLAFPVARAVGRVTLTWGANDATKYQVQTSLDGTTWRTAADVTNGTGGTVTVNAGGVARFVRVVATARRNPAAPLELREFTAFGD